MWIDFFGFVKGPKYFELYFLNISGLKCFCFSIEKCGRYGDMPGYLILITLTIFFKEFKFDKTFGFENVTD